MRRRDLVIAGLAALLLAPEHLSAQQAPGKIPRVGILTQADNERTPILDAFREGLRDLGYIEGRNIILEFRFGRGDLSRGPEFVAELASIPVDVIISEGFPSAMDPHGRVPIIGVALVDPVQRGLAASLARPGGTITGFTMMSTELNGKRVELLRSAFPGINTVAVLVNPAQPAHKFIFAQTETAARLLGLGDLRRVEAESVTALRALRPEVFSGADAVIVLPEGVFYNFHRDVVALINSTRLPAIYPVRDYADDGGLMAYGPNLADNFLHYASRYKIFV